MSKVQIRVWFLVLTILSSVGSDVFALDNKVGLGADGDSCDIDRDGIKIPGKINDLGQCCSVSDSKDCVVILKPFPTSSTKPKLNINKKLNSGEIKSSP